MPKYKITIEERATYYCEVTARSVAEAESKAEEMFLQSISIDKPFSCSVADRDVFVEKIKSK